MAVRWPRLRPAIRLRGLLLLTLAIGLALGWWALKAREQREAVAAVRALGGWVIYEDETRALTRRPNAHPATFSGRVRRWIGRRLGDDYSRDVVSVGLNPNYLKGMPPSDRPREAAARAMTLVAQLRGVTVLEIWEGWASDEALQAIGGMKGLKYLTIAEAREVTDAGLAAIARVESLETLWMTGSGVTDAELGRLSRLPNLRYLTLSGTADVPCRVTDAGLADLARLRRLEFLYLDCSRVTDAGLVHLRGHPALKVVSVQGSGVTDAGLQALRATSTRMARPKPGGFSPDVPQWSVIVGPGRSPLGTAAEVRARVLAHLPGATWTGTPDQPGGAGQYVGELYTIHFLLDPEESPGSLLVEIAGGRGALAEVRKFADPSGWTIRVEDDAPLGPIGGRPEN